MTAKTWTVEIRINEHDEARRTRAEALLRTGEGPVSGRSDLAAAGVARRNPGDPDVAEIGDELAAARALEALSRKLRDVAAADITQLTHTPAHLSH